MNAERNRQRASYTQIAPSSVYRKPSRFLKPIVHLSLLFLRGGRRTKCHLPRANPFLQLPDVCPSRPRTLQDDPSVPFGTTNAMVSVCTTCKGLQKHLSASGNSKDSDKPSVLQWVNASTLPTLRRSTAGGCRACALVLQGILLHHDRFAGVEEENIRISVQSYQSSPVEKAQDHLSVDVRWNEEPDESCDETAHDHEVGYPDLKLEFFTDDGKLFY